MIRRLFKGDRAKLCEYIGDDRAVNVGILAPLSGFGYEHPHCDVFAIIDDEKGDMTGLIGRYFGGYTLYSKTPERCAREVGVFFGMVNCFGHIQGVSQTMETVLAFIKNARSTPCELAALHSLKDPQVAKNSDIRPVSLEEIPQVYELLCDTEGFFMPAREDYSRAARERIQARCGRIYALWDKGRIVSTAATQIEGDGLALIASVATRRADRGQGFAFAVTARLCRDILDKGLLPVIVYSTPCARSLYSAIGFEKLANWCFAE